NNHCLRPTPNLASFLAATWLATKRQQTLGDLVDVSLECMVLVILARRSVDSNDKNGGSIHVRNAALPTQSRLRTLRSARRRGADPPRALRRSQPRNLRCGPGYRPPDRAEVLRPAQPHVRRA